MMETYSELMDAYLKIFEYWKSFSKTVTGNQRTEGSFVLYLYLHDPKLHGVYIAYRIPSPDQNQAMAKR